MQFVESYSGRLRLFLYEENSKFHTKNIKKSKNKNLQIYDGLNGFRSTVKINGTNIICHLRPNTMKLGINVKSYINIIV